jgi:hypothetical protein
VKLKYKIVSLPRFVVIYCNLFCFSVAITDLSANTAIKLLFILFYSIYTNYISTAILIRLQFIIYIVNDSEYSKRIERMKALMMYCILSRRINRKFTFLITRFNVQSIRYIERCTYLAIFWQG